MFKTAFLPFWVSYHHLSLLGDPFKMTSSGNPITWLRNISFLADNLSPSGNRIYLKWQGDLWLALHLSWVYSLFSVPDVPYLKIIVPEKEAGNNIGKEAVLISLTPGNKIQSAPSNTYIPFLVFYLKHRGLFYFSAFSTIVWHPHATPLHTSLLPLLTFIFPAPFLNLRSFSCATV